MGFFFKHLCDVECNLQMRTMIYEFVIRFQRSISLHFVRVVAVESEIYSIRMLYTLKRTERIACSQYSQPTRHAREPSHN
jgi:hypothetical protein